MSLWGVGSNQIPFSANITKDSNVLTNVLVGAGTSIDDIFAGQLVYGLGTTGIVYETRVQSVDRTNLNISLSNPYVATTGSGVSFIANAAVKPSFAINGGIVDAVNVFASEKGWVERYYKQRISFTGNISAGSSIISNVLVGSGATSSLVNGLSVFGVGVSTTEIGAAYITQTYGNGAGTTGLILSRAANISLTGTSFEAIKFSDETLAANRDLRSRLAEPEIQSVSFDKSTYIINSIGNVIVSFNEEVNLSGAGSTLTVVNSGSGSTTATYSKGSGTNKLYYSFGVGTTGILSLSEQTITGSSITGVDRRFATQPTFVGTGTTNSKIITGISNSDIQLVKIGYPISGNGTKASTTITKISDTSITLSQGLSSAATGAATVFTLAESNTNKTFYYSHIAGAGSTTKNLESRVARYPNTTVSDKSGTLITAIVG
jgi:hypothetical protein